MKNMHLGIQTDQSLSWHEQIQKQKRNIIFKISLLKRIKEYLPHSTRKLFYNFHIRPHFEYCNTLWSNCSKSDIDQISKLQKRAARMILDVKLQKEDTNPSAELFKELNWVTFQQNAHFRQAQLIYKLLNNLAPPYMRNLFKYMHEVIPRHLRSVSDNKLYPQNAHPKSLRYTGPRLWNWPHKEIRNATSLEQFKRMYLKHTI